MKDLRLAAAMMRAVVGDKQGNLQRVEALAVEAAGAGAELLVLPEACLTGYTVRESMARWAEPVPGPLTEAVSDLAETHGLAILAGLVEKGAGGREYLTQVLVGPDGILAAYRKTHLGPTEKTLFQAGDRIEVTEALGVRFGIQLCYEGHFPEVTLAQALGGAEVILLPHASPRESPEEKLDRWLRYMPARAYDHTVFLAAVNQVGDNGAGLTFAGIALIIGPKGQILAQAAGNQPALIVADLRDEELTAIKEGRMGYFNSQRRPELYR